MGLITKTVKVKWFYKTREHYESLGYIFTCYGDEFEVRVEDLTKGSGIRVKCVCDNCNKELSWTYHNYNKCSKENGKTYCNKCSKLIYGDEKQRKTKLKKSKSFYNWCVENSREDLLLRWDYELNGCNPNEVSYASEKGYYFKCLINPEHGSELIKLNLLILKNKNSICKKCHSIAQWLIKNFGDNALELYWDYEKNEDLDPWEVSYGSCKKVWIKCPYGHSSILISANHYTINPCCPECSKIKKESKNEKKTKQFLQQLGYEVLTEYNCTIKPINPKTKFPLPFDNEIVLSNGKHLIIEVHGEQHYNTHFHEFRKKITKEEAEKELHYQQVKDRYKRIKCIQAGYEYLEIPYTAFDKKETYKNLIDNKIKEILNK